ncbi:MAG TPA: hypothetical protein DEA96_05085 [Leptospiraceae bacterium]|nr:hypothetical protein [Spirochaetaceae bacterium]HBS04319.1 hypothetical protein [Leptospiraceae bacterium]
MKSDHLPAANEEKVSMNRHMLWMIIGCVLPLILILIYPSFGMNSETAYFAFVILIFICHLMMFRSHGHGEKGKGNRNDWH